MTIRLIDPYSSGSGKRAIGFLINIKLFVMIVIKQLKYNIFIQFLAALPKRWSVVVTPAQEHTANDPNNENDASGVSCKTPEEILEAIERVLETKCTAGRD